MKPVKTDTKTRKRKKKEKANLFPCNKNYLGVD
jgi:hypothetical protein